ncbi:fibroblast growth factor-binding protein 2 [Rana temporaria]|uniref:fibroblast growth factor-binding protein 2 n=1 Tax=Rana temporaria TaxID=8407 RepID=UPI001AADBD90|nr:fibroblast growth factor-binding protein 2 [Rana temporaria]
MAMMSGTVIITMAVIWVGTLAQKPGTEVKLPFQTKNRDACIMSTSGTTEMRVKIECKNQGKSYLCEFASKPSFCRAYNQNPQRFWEQLSQDLKKTGNPCEPQVFKHSMCPKAPTPSQFRKVDPSTNQQADTSKAEKKPPPTKKPTTKRPPITKKPEPPKAKQLEEEPNPKATKIAKDNCSWFFQTFCSYIIEIFL